MQDVKSTRRGRERFRFILKGFRFILAGAKNVSSARAEFGVRRALRPYASVARCKPRRPYDRGRRFSQSIQDRLPRTPSLTTKPMPRADFSDTGRGRMARRIRHAA